MSLHQKPGAVGFSGSERRGWGKLVSVKTATTNDCSSGVSRNESKAKNRKTRTPRVRILVEKCRSRGFGYLCRRKSKKAPARIPRPEVEGSGTTVKAEEPSAS